MLEEKFLHAHPLGQARAVVESRIALGPGDDGLLWHREHQFPVTPNAAGVCGWREARGELRTSGVEKLFGDEKAQFLQLVFYLQKPPALAGITDLMRWIIRSTVYTPQATRYHALSPSHNLVTKTSRLWGERFSRGSTQL
jgi:hypothetical protein